jgi:hypothetical protein
LGTTATLLEGPLVDKLKPAAKVYIINSDLFFDPVETPPARPCCTMRARARYAQKHLQHLHASVLSWLLQRNDGRSSARVRPA